MNDLIRTINEAAYEVRTHLAPGFLESVYQNALVVELNHRGLHVEKEMPLSVYYKSALVGDFRADIVVNGCVLIEIKACRELSPAHEAQLVNYLVATGFEKGILINYGGELFAFRVKDRVYLR